MCLVNVVYCVQTFMQHPLARCLQYLYTFSTAEARFLEMSKNDYDYKSDEIIGNCNGFMQFKIFGLAQCNTIQ